MSFFDSDAEVQVFPGDSDITGSSGKAAILLAGVTSDNSASFIRAGKTGEIQISGSVGISESVPLQIGAFLPEATASVKIVQTETTQVITGTVSVDNFPAVQVVSGTFTFQDNTVQSGSNGLTSDTTPVVVVSVPPPNKSRTIPGRGFSIINLDIGPAKFSSYINNNTGNPTQTLVEKILLYPNEKWISEEEVFLGADKYFTVVLDAPVTSSQLEWTVSFVEK